jgi:hypothetical protein
MLKNIFGDYIWISNLGNEFLEKYRTKFHDRLNDIKKANIDTSSWKYCNVKSSFFNESLIKNYLVLDFDGMFSEQLMNELNKFFDKMNEISDGGVKVNDDFIRVEKIWYNVYEYSDFQEVHCHSGRDSFYSFVYILESKNKELDSTLVFDNPRSNVLMTNRFDQLIKIDNYKRNYTPDLDNGYLMIFPSHMNHFVSRHNNPDENRISISGNIIYG